MSLLRQLAALCIALVVLTDAANAAADEDTIRLGIVLDDRGSPAARHLAATIAEADRIWHRHGVTVLVAGAVDFAPDALRLTLTFEPARRKPGQEPGLGSIWFDEDGSPGNVVALDLTAVTAHIKQATIGGRPYGEWPPALAAQMVGRALGRVLAHEIGHYLLASPAHARTGLMQAAFNSRELAGWDRRSFELDETALPRLRARLARLESRQKTLAAARESTR